MTTPSHARPYVDSQAAIRFIESAYAPDDWLALVARSHASGVAVQRVRQRDWFTTPRVHAWLRALNAQRWNHYFSINAFAPGERSRRRTHVVTVRHVLLDADLGGGNVVQKIASRRDLPPPSYVIHSSPDRLHVLWRVTGFGCDQVELLQRHLAGELNTDLAATPCSQTTRLPGYANHKYSPAPLVTIEHLDTRATYAPGDFPQPSAAATPPCVPPRIPTRPSATDVGERARRYLVAVEPAVAGQHGDQRTFQVCCRLVRGFALSDAQALDILAEWNARCRPPWSARELEAKLRHARRYGREPIGGYIDSS